MSAAWINVADLVDPNDPDGRTYRQVNTAKIHIIEIGTLVELESGVRLFVVQHNRDCDRTPLYCLGPDPEDLEPRYGFAMNPGWISGYAEESLRTLAGEKT